MSNEAEQLTQEQVNALDDGVHVIITWSGGNGPHRYVVKHRFDTVWAYTPPPQNVPVSPIDFVGPHRYNTHVWLDTTDPG